MSEPFNELEISKAIVNSYHEFYLESLSSDVLIAGAGPSGLLAANILASAGKSVTIIEKRLSPGGGIWGGGMTLSKIVVQQAAVKILEQLGVRFDASGAGLYVADACELACALGLRAVQAGARLLNLHQVEDICLDNERVTGLVINRTGVLGTLPVDPLVFKAKVVVDTTGHDAVAVACLRKRGYLSKLAADCPYGEGAMNAPAGERFVVENTQEVFPGLWVAGMSVCATFGGPRMGPIFGGMLLSGKRVAEQLLE